MEITDVRIKLMEEPGKRLQAFCSITFDDCFVIRDLKIINWSNGPFVTMPCRKLTSHCPQCGAKNHLRASYCNECGLKLNSNRAPLDKEDRAKLYADIAHPINSACREATQERILREFLEEKERAKLPGYVSRYDDFDIDNYVPARHSRGPARSHPTTTYTRSGSEPDAGVQMAESVLRPPHKAAVSPTKSTERHSPGAAASDGKPTGDSTQEGFGAGVF